jgi:hypothetical protein
MTDEDPYEIWRPERSPWRQWVKPVVFPFLTTAARGGNDYSVRDWKVPLQPDTAIIADLPGAEGVSAGIAMARAGYLPVLVYNACPTPTFDAASTQFASIWNPQPIDPPVVVDMSSILTALRATTSELAALGPSIQAPPVFLLDSNRRGLGIPYGPGWFDNRSFVGPSDFPSAGYFRSRGISKVILLQPTPDINSDLLQVLLQLQREGIAISAQTPWKAWEPRPLVVKPPMFIIFAWEWLRRRFGYRRDTFQECFGRVVPHSSG